MGGLVARILFLIFEAFLGGLFFGIGREAGTDAYRNQKAKTASSVSVDDVPEPEEIDIELD